MTAKIGPARLILATKVVQETPFGRKLYSAKIGPARLILRGWRDSTIIKLKLTVASFLIGNVRLIPKITQKLI